MTKPLPLVFGLALTLLGVAASAQVPDGERPVGRIERHDGRLGAICDWGERRPGYQRLPTPRLCRAGLRCCPAGGAAGSDSTCRRGACPRYP